MRKTNSFPWSLLFSVLLIVAVLVIAIVGLRGAESARDGEAKRVPEDSLNRAAVSCYAIEGMYPDTLEYLTENYGVYVDPGKYAVKYEVFASNIMPDITVLEN